MRILLLLVAAVVVGSSSAQAQTPGCLWEDWYTEGFATPPGQGHTILSLFNPLPTVQRVEFKLTLDAPHGSPPWAVVMLGPFERRPIELNGSFGVGANFSTIARFQYGGASELVRWTAAWTDPDRPIGTKGVTVCR